MPLGGYKQSGLGPEGGKHVIEVFTWRKPVYVKLQLSARISAALPQSIEIDRSAALSF
jgi:hypothetical protein